MRKNAFDVLVIGSGPGGAVTAALAAESGLSVAILEEGGHRGGIKHFSSAEILTKYRNGGLTAAFGSPRILYGEGKCLGGGSEINAGLYYRTPDRVLDEWAEKFGLLASGSADMRPHFEAIEADLGISPVGEPVRSTVTQKLASAADSLGWKYTLAPRAIDGKGEKRSMTAVYLPRAERAGCRVYTESRALGLARLGGRWRVITAGGDFFAESIFVCGGAIGSAALLRRSGIRANIGNSLQLHPMVKVVARFPQTLQTQSGVTEIQVREFWPRVNIGGSVTSAPLLALELAGRARMPELVRSEADRMAIFYASCLPRGKGTVRNVPGFNDPLVRFRAEKEDLDALGFGARKLGELLFAAGAAELFPSAAGADGCSSLRAYEDFLALRPLRKWKVSSVHLFASCPMGEARSSCAVNSFGQVFGQKGLYVADASMLCSAPGVNPQGTIMAFSRRNVLRFLSERGLR